MNLSDGLELLGNDVLGEFGVRESFDEILAVAERPLQQILDGIALSGVGELTRNEQPSEAGNWIGGFAGAVGNGDAEVGGHVFGGACGRGADAGEIGLDEGAGGVLYGAEGDVVLRGVGELDVGDGVRRLLDETGDAFAPLAAETDGSVD